MSTAWLLGATLAVTALVVLVLVGYLLGIIVALWGARRSLARLAAGLVAVRDNTAPLGDKLGQINGGLKALLQGLLAVDGDLSAVIRIAQGVKQPGRT